jgi:hypothetical protein
MAGPDLGYTVLSGPEWERVIAALGRVDEELPHKLRDSIKEDAEDLADVARGRVVGLPTRDGHRKHLFEKVAAGVHVDDQGNGGVRVNTSMPTPSEGIIPRGLDRLKGWRHPLFGDKDHWFSNPGYSWFVSTFSDGKDKFESGLNNVLEAAAKDVAEAGGVEL